MYTSLMLIWYDYNIEANTKYVSEDKFKKFAY